MATLDQLGSASTILAKRADLAKERKRTLDALGSRGDPSSHRSRMEITSIIHIMDRLPKLITDFNIRVRTPLTDLDIRIVDSPTFRWTSN